MRLFRKKSDSPGNKEYLDGLITSIRQARREDEERPGLHAFVEEDDFPMGDSVGPPRVPPGVAKAGRLPETPAPPQEAEEIANLEAYLSALNAAEATPEDEDHDQSSFAAQ